MMRFVKFRRKPMPLLADLRPIYKIGQILMVLKISSRGGRASLGKIQLMNWGMKSDLRRSLLIESASGDQVVVGVWGMDPIINFALQFATAEMLIERDRGSYKLLPKGEKYVSAIINSGAMDDEKEFLEKIGKNITESKIQEIIGAWG